MSYIGFPISTVTVHYLQISDCVFFTYIYILKLILSHELCIIHNKLRMFLDLWEKMQGKPRVPTYFIPYVINS
jgi:hypothetical protein